MYNKKMNYIYKILDVLILLFPFIDGTYSFETRFLCVRLSYIIYLLYLIVHFKEILSINFSMFFNKKILKNIYVYALIIIVFSSIVNVYLDNSNIILLLKQLIIIPFVAFTIWIFFRVNKNDIQYIINLYLKITFAVCIIGIFQELSFLVGFKYGYDFSYFKIGEQISIAGNYLMRVTSVCSEPSCLGGAIPAFYISLNSYLTNNKQVSNKLYFFVITICLLLTYSTVVYLGMVLSLFLILVWNYKLIKIRNFVIFACISVLLASFGFYSISGRIDGLFKKINIENLNTAISENVNNEKEIKTKELQNSQKIHINRSSYYLIWHFKTAFESFKEHPFFGTGLGSYFIIFQKYNEQFHYDKTVPVSNSKDGNSLFIRVMGELGIFGLMFLFLFVFSNYIKNYSYRNQFNYWIIINNAILVYLLLRIARSGVYHSDGVFIFVWIYFLSKLNFKKELKS